MSSVFRAIVSTHFEPTDARSAFPCLDEPFFKATFHITIIHEQCYIALGNMPVKESSELVGGFVKDEFEPTVSMSTYLVAFSVNDFKYRGTKTKSGIRVSEF